jgi:hypothetical protein
MKAFRKQRPAGRNGTPERTFDSPDTSSTIWRQRCHVPRYESGDFVKVEFESDTKGLPGEWMWVRVHHCDDERQLVFGTLDNEPVVNSEHLQLGQELAVSYGKIREHRKPTEIRLQ